MLRIIHLVHGRPRTIAAAYGMLVLFVLVFAFTVAVGVMDGVGVDGIVTPVTGADGDKAYVVVVDPGHGGRDPGSLGRNGTEEKGITLDISRRLVKALKAKDIVAYSTREDDVDYGNADFPGVTTKKRRDLNERLRIIGEWKPDVMISIHANSFPDPIWHGAQTFYYDSGDCESDKLLARSIQERLVKDLGPNNRVAKHADIYILRKCDVPCVTVEVGFLSNPHEEELLGTPDYRQRLAESIRDGILDFQRAQAKPDAGGTTEPDTVQSSTVPMEKSADQVVLYFASPTNSGDGLTAELRSIGTDTRKIPASLLVSRVMEELLKGPGPQSILSSAIPAGVGLRTAYAENGVAHIDLSSAQGVSGGAGSEELAVMAMVRTLTSLPGIEQVKLSVDGSDDTTLSGHIMLDEAFNKADLTR